MEILVPLNPTQEEKSLLDMHSVLNVLNVINFELMQISERLGEDEFLFELMEEVSEAGATLRDPEAAHRLVEDMESFITRIEATLDAAIDRHASVTPEDFRENRDNLKTIFDIIRVRAREILHRLESPDEWVDWEVETLRGNFVDFLSSVEQNSHGGYRIVPNVAAQGVGDYLIHFHISSDEGDRLRMPVVFQDVMRDILANARKYTRPGGMINGGLHAGKDKLRFVVQDNGVGIPREALPDVVLFGKRADNVLDRKTYGGGFGLTKAYYVTKQFNGSMWIDSKAGEGNGDSYTRIEIQIPYAPPGPPSALARVEGLIGRD